ncbi:hypothetical protein KAW18_03070 [candidate division WOR-3 bacterium]|nr:hypothetical protein [candidate division WOR-3 bacterium]
MKNRDGAFYVYWDAKRGILLYFDTYGDNINGGEFAYNWIPRDRQAAYRYTSSGGFEKHNDGMVWVGYHSCGGGNIDVNIKNLEENGEFVVPWVRKPFLWLLHYKDTEKYGGSKEYKEVNEQRIAMLPKDIQTAIKGIEKIGGKKRNEN